MNTSSKQTIDWQCGSQGNESSARDQRCHHFSEEAHATTLHPCCGYLMQLKRRAMPDLVGYTSNSAPTCKLHSVMTHDASR